MLQDASLRLEATNLKTNTTTKIETINAITNMMFSINLSAELVMAGAPWALTCC